MTRYVLIVTALSAALASCASRHEAQRPEAAKPNPVTIEVHLARGTTNGSLSVFVVRVVAARDGNVERLVGPVVECSLNDAHVVRVEHDVRFDVVAKQVGDQVEVRYDFSLGGKAVASGAVTAAKADL